MPSCSGANSPQPGVATPAVGAGERRLSNSSDCSTGSGNTRASSASVDQSGSCTEYLSATATRGRVSRAPPPRPAANPLQFVKVGPADLYRTAQEQLKKAELVKKSKEVTKVDQEDWQSNLDNWKCSRRKRVEHIIEKVVEVKRLTDEASVAAARRKAKTFNEMIEERAGRRRRCPLALYAEEEATDFSDLGIGTSSTKSSLSEDCDAHSLASDGVELEKNHSDIDNMSGGETERISRKFGSSANEYDTCTTATISSPEPEEYTYEGAIESYKSRVISKTKVAILDSHFNNNLSTISKDTNGNLPNGSSGKFSVRCVDKPLLFEARRTSDVDSAQIIKKDIPKIDILKRREMFEKESSPNENDNTKSLKNSVDINTSKSIKDRLSSLGKSTEEMTIKDVESKRLPSEVSSVRERLDLFKKGTSPENDVVKNLNSNGDIFNTRSLKERLSSLQTQAEDQMKVNKVTSREYIPSIKERLSSLDSYKSKNSPKSTPERDTFNAKLMNYNVEIETDQKYVNMDSSLETNNELKSQRQPFHHSMDNFGNNNAAGRNFDRIQSLEDINTNHIESTPLSPNDTDREDSGVHTADGSCAVSQADDNGEMNDLSSNLAMTEDSAQHKNELLQSCIIRDDQFINKAEVESVSSDLKSDPLTDQSLSESHSTLNSQIERSPSALEDNPEENEGLDKDDEETLKSIEQHDISVLDALELAFREIDGDELGAKSYDGDLMECDSLENYMSVAVSEELMSIPRHGESVAMTIVTEENLMDMNSGMQNYSVYGCDNVDSKDDDIQSDPNTIGLPIYENVMYGSQGMMPLKLGAEDGIISFPLGPPLAVLEPPKEKPPPPPVDESLTNDAFKRVNSTRRIKKEIRNKRTSFLGIEGNDDSYLEPELKLAPRPDITTFLQEESRYEKLYKTSLSRELTSNLGESCDSGLDLERANSADIWAKETTQSGQHSRQNSEPLTLTSVTSDEDAVSKPDYNTIGNGERESKWQQNGDSVLDEQLNEKLQRLECESDHSQPSEEVTYRRRESDRIRALEEQVKEQQDVLRVERELLLLEQEELKRQRINLLHKENQARKLNNRSLQDISGLHFSQSANVQEYYPYGKQSQLHRKSMPNLANCQPELLHFVETQSTEATRHSMTNNDNSMGQNGSPIINKRVPPPPPPTKPLRSAELQERENSVRCSRTPSAGDIMNIDRNYPVQYRQKSNSHILDTSNDRLSHHPMSRNTLQNLSAAPRSRLIQSADWMQAKRKSEPPAGYNYNQHWLIQEAEQRRIEQQQQLSARIRQQQQVSNSSQRTRHLPDSVIQTLTQRVQNMTSRSSVNSVPKSTTSSSPPNVDIAETGEKMLSVSGRKKCSHCGEELGRGAAMIIESLGLFYHLACFACSVCGARLGDGRAGADVRVRARRLHCHQCYSSDDGVNFSCV